MNKKKKMGILNNRRSFTICTRTGKKKGVGESKRRSWDEKRSNKKDGWEKKKVRMKILVRGERKEDGYVDGSEQVKNKKVNIELEKKGRKRERDSKKEEEEKEWEEYKSHGKVKNRIFTKTNFYSCTFITYTNPCLFTNLIEGLT